MRPSKRRALVIGVDSTLTEVQLSDSDSEHMEAVVGGWFDIAMLAIGEVSIGLVVNDRGLIENKPINKLASALRGAFVVTQYPLAGPAILVAADCEGEGVDLPQEWIELVVWLDRAVKTLRRPT